MESILLSDAARGMQTPQVLLLKSARYGDCNTICKTLYPKNILTSTSLMIHGELLPVILTSERSRALRSSDKRVFREHSHWKS